MMGGMGQVYSVMYFLGALFIGHLKSTHESLIFLPSGISIFLEYIITRASIKKF